MALLEFAPENNNKLSGANSKAPSMIKNSKKPKMTELEKG